MAKEKQPTSQPAEMTYETIHLPRVNTQNPTGAAQDDAPEQPSTPKKEKA